LKGWRFIYLKDYVVPSELPVETAAFMRQQFRWAKGSTQTALKLLPRILRSGVDPRVKLEAFFHLTANVSYVLIVGIGLLLGPVIWARYRLGLYHLLWLDVPLFCLATLSVATFYVLSQRENPTGLRGWWNWLWVIPMLMAVGIGISLNNARGVLEALLGVTSPFERTPKYGITHASAHPGWTLSAYRLKNWLMPLLGLGMGLYFLAVLYLCIEEDLWYSIPFVVLFMVGFLYTSGTTLWQTWVLPWTVRRLGVAPARHPLGM
jgi:cellulose synthase/poly-beta-1,6-N-acetylglucosamine synthase-like glycosyltransferase